MAPTGSTAIPDRMTFTWNGVSMVPLPGFRAFCSRAFVGGQRYILSLSKHRSREEHNLFFSAINEAFDNLPETLIDRYKDETGLRKRALIDKGFAHEALFVCATDDDVARNLKFLKAADEYVVCEVSGNVIRAWTALSQSEEAMGAERFRQSFEAVLDYCANLIGVSAEQLIRQVKDRPRRR